VIAVGEGKSVLKQRFIRSLYVAIGAVLTLVPLLGATVMAGAATKGKAPGSPLCQSLRTLTPTLYKDASAYKSAEKARKWPAEKAAYLAGLQVQLQEYGVLRQSSNDVPHNVRLAEVSTLKAAHSLQRDLSQSRSAAQFTSPGSSVVVLTFDHAQQPILRYFGLECGT
jgi:hypothetical protein